MTGNEINARDCPSTDCNIQRVISSSDQFKVLGSYGEWYWVEFIDGQRAYIFGGLMELPEGAVVALAPTMTPSFTPSFTPTASPTRPPTNTPRPSSTPTGTATPFQFDEETILTLIKYAMLSSDYDINSIEIRNGVLIVQVPDILSTDSEEILTYRMGYIGSFAGAATAAYKGENVIASPPQEMRVDFMIGEYVSVRISYLYRDALAFINGEITALQFFSTWTVE